MPVYEDITQEAFIRLWQKHAAFSCESSIKAFLYTITRNACLNFIKHCRRRQKSKRALVNDLANAEDCVLRRMLQADVSNEVQAAVKKLPPECGRIVWMGYIEGFGNQQIAQQLQLSVSTVKNQKTRGLNLLKKKFIPPD